MERKYGKEQVKTKKTQTKRKTTVKKSKEPIEIKDNKDLNKNLNSDNDSENEIKDNKKKIFCLHCGEGSQINFHYSFDPMNTTGKLPYCKKCIKDVIYPYYLKMTDNNEHMAIHHCLRSLNIAYLHEIYLSSLQETKNPKSMFKNLDGTNQSALILAYIKNYNSFNAKNGYGKTYAESDGLTNIEGLNLIEDKIIIKRKYPDVDKITDEDKDNYDVIEYNASDLILKWGTFEDWELIYLENEYMDWVDKIGEYIEEKTTDWVVRQLCLSTLDIQKKRQRGERVKEEVDTVQKLMVSSGLINKQNINLNKERSVGMDIALIEKSRPLAKCMEGLEDVDNFNEIKTAVLGGFSRAMGKENIFTENFDKIYNEYTIDLLNMNDVSSPSINSENNNKNKNLKKE